jgi:hypothetical protein
MVPPGRRSHCWFELAKGPADVVDSCIAGHDRGMDWQRRTMRQATLRCDGTCLFARCRIRRTRRMESGADASRRISVCCFRHHCGRLPGGRPVWQVQEEGLKGMKIEVLYFENCPNHLPTLERIHQVLREEGCDAEVREVLVPDVETAHNVRFLGSPTVRVNGVDIEPKAEERKEFGLMCRRYASGIPSHALIREAVRSASVGATHNEQNSGRDRLIFSVMYEDCCPLFTKLGRMFNLNREKNVSNGRKSGDR